MGLAAGGVGGYALHTDSMQQQESTRRELKQKVMEVKEMKQQVDRLRKEVKQQVGRYMRCWRGWRGSCGTREVHGVASERPKPESQEGEGFHVFM